MEPSQATGLARAFNWAANVAKYLLQVLGPATVQDSLLTKTAGSDSDFTGGGGAWEVASAMISGACAGYPELQQVDLCPQTICDTGACFRVVFCAVCLLSGQLDQPLPAKEYDASMRALLVPRLAPTTCVFKDILEIWGQPEAVGEALDSIRGYQSKVHFASALPRWTHGWCEAHQCWCPYRQSRVRVQGPPCVDWSNAGCMSGVDGPFFKTLLASGAKSDLTAPALNIVENVPGMPLDVLRDCYGPVFSWTQSSVKPADVGFSGISRTRTDCVSSLVVLPVFYF